MGLEIEGNLDISLGKMLILIEMLAKYVIKIYAFGSVKKSSASESIKSRTKVVPQSKFPAALAIEGKNG